MNTRKKQIKLQIVVTQDMFDALDRQADAQGLSMGTIARHAIAVELAKRGVYVQWDMKPGPTGPRNKKQA